MNTTPLGDRPHDLILFDLDGTLIETAPEIADAVNDTLLQFGHAPASQQQITDWIGHGTRELLIQALAQATHTTAEAVRGSAQFATIEASFGEHYLRRCGSRSQLYPQLRATLTALRAAGVRLALVTNKEARYTQAVLDAHQLDQAFDKPNDVLGPFQIETFSQIHNAFDDLADQLINHVTHHYLAHKGYERPHHH